MNAARDRQGGDSDEVGSGEDGSGEANHAGGSKRLTTAHAV